jgi:hypothetical protein
VKLTVSGTTKFILAKETSLNYVSYEPKIEIREDLRVSFKSTLVLSNILQTKHKDNIDKSPNSKRQKLDHNTN